MSASDFSRELLAAGVVALYLAMCAAIFWRERRHHLRAEREAASLAPSANSAPPWLVAYASQTGSAEQLAWQTARALRTAGAPARVLPLGELTADHLASAGHVLFIVSTYGEGDPPDNAALFAQRVLGTALPLPNLRYAVLALGDREYVNFCGFGRSLDAWLREQDAQPLFDRIDVDKADDASLVVWQHQLGHVAGTRDLIDWQAPAYDTWRLVERRHLNPGSAGDATYHLELEPVSGDAPHWQAGDLVQLRLPADPSRPREYSIASLPSDGRVHLLVRQRHRQDGSLGLASGWLTAQAAIGGTVELRLREHRNFRVGDNASRALLLIGNGTGLAGLRAHLKARALKPSRNWLVFGERNAAHDQYHAAELADWRQQGVLERCDLVFSRDGGEHRYVQDRLRGEAGRVREWLDAGAAVYVCGSLEGMAGGVDAALVEIAGQDGVDRLVEEGRYRRDVY
jgi:sulfite reductase (NADPH) flavoprotein alpha-component